MKKDIIDMEQSADGSYVVSRQSETKPKHYVQRGKQINRDYLVKPYGPLGMVYDFLGGFIIGLEAVDRIFERMRKKYGI